MIDNYEPVTAPFDTHIGWVSVHVGRGIGQDCVRLYIVVVHRRNLGPEIRFIVEGNTTPVLHHDPETVLTKLGRKIHGIGLPTQLLGSDRSQRGRGHDIETQILSQARGSNLPGTSITFRDASDISVQPVHAALRLEDRPGPVSQDEDPYLVPVRLVDLGLVTGGLQIDRAVGLVPGRVLELRRHPLDFALAQRRLQVLQLCRRAEVVRGPVPAEVRVLAAEEAGKARSTILSKREEILGEQEDDNEEDDGDVDSGGDAG